MSRGAGGSEGGTGRFFTGLVMMIAGGYLFFNSIRVSHGFHMGYHLYSFGRFHLTSGMVMVPLIFGVGIIFYNSKNILGWILSASSLIMLAFGVISSIRFTMKSMSSFDLIVIIVLAIGGLGLFLSSLKDFNSSSAE
ncbi:MAG: hypothetical protein CSA18_03405 [Deltaproteobacteria bacterium]|nr:MAG: hypothetical protein CSA18_03405 [Deltaproteobacteria bacterium]